MAKIKVHELAKEVGADRKAVIEYLRAKGYETMTAVSAVPEGEVENVRSRFGSGKSDGASDFSGVSTVRQDGGTAEDGQKKKGKGIVRVFRSQNAAGSQKRQKGEAEADKKEENANAQSAREGKDAANAAPAAKADAPAKDATGRPQDGSAEAKDATGRPQDGAAEAKDATGHPQDGSAAAKDASASDKDEKADKAKKMAAPAEKAKPVQGEKNAENRNAAGSARKAPQREGASASGGRQAGQAGGRDGRNSGDRRPSGQGQGDRRIGNQGGDRRQGGQGDRRTMGQGGDRRQGGRDGQGRPAGGRSGAGQGERRPAGREGQGGDRRPAGLGGMFGQRAAGNAGQGRTPGMRPGPSQSGDRRTVGRSDGQGRMGAARPGGRDAQGRPGMGQGGQRRSQPAAAGDGALAHKTSRDHRKDNSKEYDRNREERRENGKHSQFGTRPNQSKKQFNRIPKALQQTQHKADQPKAKEVVTEIKIPEKITIRDLADAMKMAPTALVKDLFLKGQMVTVNHEIPFEKAQEIAMDYDIIAEQEEKEDVLGALLAEDAEDEKDMVPRPPVVCVMGHVDHGKTSLLDAIRDTHVTDREAGGITQHIGAYMVTVHGQKITFLDTPGHEAFTAMRMRGANSTDIAVLVVAADDGVMPQTVEAINHAKAANVDIIVAINKIDKPGANIERVKQELSEYELVPEEWGGQTIFCPVSAKTQEGIENLLEMILLTAEMDELKANPNRKARGLVLEAKLDKGRGPVATILVQKGTLKQGDFIACGSAHGKVRAMTDEKGKRLTKAKPSMPVEIIGLSSVPDAGEVLVALDSDKEAKAFAQTFVTEGKKNLIEATKTQMSLDDIFNQIKEGELKELPIVVKADVQGSVEAVKQSLVKLSNEEVVVKVIHGGVGN
ncbi:MAG: translation initiation factor IF-2, partial [Lachnospiraceae bacterium]|nr:translation initiation factor IF-2 [Lachnospiraceae bacterium]